MLRTPQDHVVMLRSKPRSAVAICRVGLRGVRVLPMIGCPRTVVPRVVGERGRGAGEGVFDVEHWVIGAGGDVEAVGAEVEQGEEGGCEAGILVSLLTRIGKREGEGRRRTCPLRRRRSGL